MPTHSNAPRASRFQLYLPESDYLTTEVMFRRYEKYIELFLRNLPNATVFRVTDIAPATFVNYLRKLIGALLHPNNIWATNIKHADLHDAIDAGLQFLPHLRNGTVTVKLRSTDLPESKDRLILTEEMIELDPNDDTTLHALCHLKNVELLTNPISLVGLDESRYDALEAAYPNISLGRDGHSTIIF